MKEENIPTTLEEAIEWLQEETDPAIMEKIETGELDAVSGHHGVGRWMRNNWGLWSGSKLQEYFHDLGIRHADDMSGIILESFQRTLRDEPIELEEQVEYYRNYWKDHGTDPDQIGKQEEG